MGVKRALQPAVDLAAAVIVDIIADFGMKRRASRVIIVAVQPAALDGQGPVVILVAQRHIDDVFFCVFCGVRLARFGVFIGSEVSASTCSSSASFASTPAS